ncbi:MAG: hypothetical protein LBI29_00760 [Rickettsiales bacterium]|jgi:uncharacterized membrane protein|nr:hypothetical protein [Rickettsiales bacterium]
MKIMNQNHQNANESTNAVGREDSFLPSPEILAKYKNSGMIRELMDFVEKEQEHRQKLQAGYLLSYRRGQSFGFFLSVFFLWGIFNLVKSGHTRETYILSAIFSSVFLVVVFIVKTRRKTSDITERRSNEPHVVKSSYSKPANRR